MSRVPNATRNKELARKYGVTGYPTVLLMSADGEVYGKTGYRKGGPEAYVEHIKGLRATGRKELVKSQKTVAAYNSAKGKAKAKALENLLSVLSELPKGSPFSAKLVEPAMSALTLDPKNEKGLLLKAVRALSLAGIHEAELLGAATKFDASNKEGVLELAVMAMFESVTDADSASAAVKELDTVNTYDFQDKKTGFMMNFTAATWSAGPLNNPDAVKGYVARAKKTGHEDAKLMERLDELSKGN